MKGKQAHRWNADLGMKSKTLWKIFGRGPAAWFRFFRSLRSHGPKGIFLHTVLDLTGNQMLLYYTGGYLILVIMFACIYYLFDVGIVAGDKQSPGPEDFLDFFHFSFTTQTTLGYGDYEPKSTPSRVIITIQIIGSMIYTACGVAVIAARMIRRRANIIFPDRVVYDYQRHELCFVIWNRNADHLCNVECKVLIRKWMKTIDYGERVRRICEIALRKQVPPYFNSMAVVLVVTSSGLGDPRQVKRLDPYGVSPMSLLSIGCDDVISIVLTGNSVDSGAPVVAVKTYFSDDVACGRFERYDSIEFDKLPSGELWNTDKYNKFGKITSSSPTSDCPSCSIKESCFIRERRSIAS